MVKRKCLQPFLKNVVLISQLSFPCNLSSFSILVYFFDINTQCLFNLKRILWRN